MAQKRNHAITLCRVCSMLMIVLCHIIGKYTFIPGYDFLGDILDVGVYSFFAMSGYLYGTKTVTDFRKWMTKRVTAVVLPATILSVIVMVIYLLLGYKRDLFSVVIQLLNLQGLGFIHPSFYRYFYDMPALGPLWFVTVIMLCYCMVPALQRWRKNLAQWKHGYAIDWLAAGAAFAVKLFTGFSLVYFVTFAVGYALSARKDRNGLHWTDLLPVTGMMLLAQILRMVLRAKCDGTPLYQTYALFSHMFLGIWILYFFLALQQFFPSIMKRLGELTVIQRFDDLSVYIFMTHCVFCRGYFDIYAKITNIWGSTVVFVAATLISAYVLKYITEFVRERIAISLCKKRENL